MRNKKIIIVLFFIVFVSTLFAKNPFIDIRFLHEWESAVQISKSSNLPLLVVLYKNKSELKPFKKKPHAELLGQEFIPVSAAIDTEFGLVFSEMTGIETFPLSAILNTDELILTVADDLNRTELTNWLNYGIDLNRMYPTLLLTYKHVNLKKDDLYNMVMIQHYNLGYSTAFSDAQELIYKLEPTDLYNSKYWPFLYNYGIDIYHPLFTTITTDSTLLDSSLSSFNWKRFYKNAYNLNLTFAINNQDELRRDKIPEVLFPINPVPSTRMDTLLLMQRYFEGVKDWDRYMSYTLGSLERLPKDSANLYVREANYLWNTFESSLTDSLSMVFIEKGLQKKKTFELCYSYAEILLDKDYLEVSLEYCEKALDLAQNSREEKMTRKLKEKVEIYLSWKYQPDFE